MYSPVLLFGEPIEKTFFHKLLEDKDSKYITEFKRYFNYLKKNHENYKDVSIYDLVSIDEPLLDYVSIINDWLSLESDNIFRLYIDKNKILYFGFNLSNPVNTDKINKLCKDWKRDKEIKKLYFEWISKFDISKHGPLLVALY